MNWDYHQEDSLYIKIDWKNFQTQFLHETGYLKDYINFNTEKLRIRKAQLDEFLKQDIQEHPCDESFLKNIYDLDYIKIPSYFYHSAIVSLYSLLENSLNLICYKIQTETQLVIGLSDITGTNIIQKARKFLSLFAKIDFSIIDKEWLRITDYQKIRNLIVHQNSQFRESHQQQNEDIMMLKKFKGIELDKHNYTFYITNDIILTDFLSLINDFISNIISQLSCIKFKKFNLSTNFNKEFDFPF